MLNLSQEELVDELNSKCRKNVDGSDIKKYTLAMVKNIEVSRTPYTYFDLESYGRTIGVPAGVLLIVSHFQHESSERIKAVSDSIYDVLGRAADSRGSISFYHLEMISNLIKPSYGDNHGQFPAVNFRSTLERYQAIKIMKPETDASPEAGLDLWSQKNN